MPSFLATRSVILILVVHDRLVSFLTRLLHSLAHYLLARVNDICVCDTKLGLWNCLITALSSVAGSPCRPRLFDPGWHCFIFSCVLKSRTATWATPTYQPCFIAKATYVWWVVTLLFFSTGPVNVILWTKPACSALRRPWACVDCFTSHVMMSVSIGLSAASEKFREFFRLHIRALPWWR